MSPIAGRLSEIRARIASACRSVGRSPDEVTLIAVTKGFGPEAVREAVAAGVLHIGENRVQEAEAKRVQLGALAGVTWHMIGHLQTNKVKAALQTFDIIHSVDSIHLAEAVSQRASAAVPAFLEVNAAGEATKSGFRLEELASAYEEIVKMPNIELRGLMTVAPIAPDPEEVRPVFRRLREEAHRLGLRELSMGMTDDFEVAIEEGATHVRVGRAIFGERAG
jgi:pyridoxal phosphate enzyme (YggS family)